LKQFEAAGYKFKEGKVYIVHNNRETELDLELPLDEIVHQMQRIMVPLVELLSEQDVVQFLDTSSLTASSHDYIIGKHGLYKSLKSDSPWTPANIDDKVQNMGYQTRLVMFVTDKELYENELEAYHQAAWIFSSQHNMRLGIVSDFGLIKLLKERHLQWFETIGYN
jgi:hypothetical protein